MKVVLFCGGLGMRLRDYSDDVPNLMKYYAHFGHKDFILCLGYKADVVKNYFRTYDECLSNDFVLTRGGRQIDLVSSDIDDWRITFVDTGTTASIGERLMAVRPYLEGEEAFLANYADGLSDLDLGSYVDEVLPLGRVASFLAVRPTQTFHLVDLAEDGAVNSIVPVADSEIWVNGGFFLLRQEIFDYMRPGEDLVAEPFDRLRAAGALHGHRYRGFWTAMDTFKDKARLDEMYGSGDAPWELWKADGDGTAAVQRLRLAGSAGRSVS
jgi:glucose-1-phosphate cytidylyltransferase